MYKLNSLLPEILTNLEKFPASLVILYSPPNVLTLVPELNTTPPAKWTNIESAFAFITTVDVESLSMNAPSASEMAFVPCTKD